LHGERTLEEQTELDGTNRTKGLTAPSQQSTITTFHAQVRGADARVRSMKCRAPIFGTKKSSGMLILRFAEHSQKTTWAGWLKSFVLPVSGRGTLVLWILGQSQKTTRVGWLESSTLPILGQSTWILWIVGNVRKRGASAKGDASKDPAPRLPNVSAPIQTSRVAK